MRHSQEKEIDGHTWLVGQLPATEALRILTKLTKILGPSIAEFTGSIKMKPGSKSILDAEIDSDAIAKAVKLLVERLDESEVENLVKRLLKDVRCDGQEVVPQFDIVFMGRLSTLFKVLVFVLEVNYGDFFAISKTLSEMATVHKLSPTSAE